MNYNTFDGFEHDKAILRSIDSHRSSWSSSRIIIPRISIKAGITMVSTRRYPRRLYNDRSGIPVTIIQFGMLKRIDVTVQCIDISDGGLGIVADVPLSPGFVWFRGPINKQKGGMIVWSRKTDSRFRAGIQFLPIPSSPSDYLQMTRD